MIKNEQLRKCRPERHLDELKWLHTELYDNQQMFDKFCAQMRQFYQERKPSLKRLDGDREQNPGWYHDTGILGMMMYTEQFASNLKGVQKHLDYLKRCNVNYLHLMPLLEPLVGRSDGEYAISDFRSVQSELGTMEGLEKLAVECHRQGISLCPDFVMNHTSKDHEWAKRARNGEQEYRDRYFFYDDCMVPVIYEKTVPQAFPTTAPGDFTWLQDTGKFVMTALYPYQWDLNYHSPAVSSEMMYNFLYLANRDIDVIRIDVVPYIWKELGTDCRNLPKVHTIVRMTRMISEIVCPDIILLGGVVMEPEKVASYLGTVEKPERHTLYNVTTMATIWNSVATQDVRPLKRQMEIISSLPDSCTYLNYFRCHDDIGWGLDCPLLAQWGMKQVPHKKFLNDLLTGKSPDSFSRGELYNEDLVTGDVRLCETTASLRGIEKAGFENNQEGMQQAIRLDMMLHAFLLFLLGIPMLCSGDETGQANDYSYKQDAVKAPDSRFLHRGKFHWELVGEVDNPGTVQAELSEKLNCPEPVRRKEPLLHASVPFHPADTWDGSLLCLVRRDGDGKLIGLLNFSELEKQVDFSENADGVQDTVKGITVNGHVILEVFGFR